MRILITAGPTREYLDDVRFLSNASSGRMGYALAQASLDAGHDVALVTGPVEITPPAACEVHRIETTDQLQATCLDLFPECDGVIAAAAVCDYRPRKRISGKISRNGKPILLELVETADVLAELGSRRQHRWVVGFALESQDPRTNALRKLKMKNCDCIVVNDTSAISSLENSVEVINSAGETIASFSDRKISVARKLIALIEQHIARS